MPKPVRAYNQTEILNRLAEALRDERQSVNHLLQSQHERLISHFTDNLPCSALNDLRPDTGPDVDFQNSDRTYSTSKSAIRPDKSVRLSGSIDDGDDIACEFIELKRNSSKEYTEANGKRASFGTDPENDRRGNLVSKALSEASLQTKGTQGTNFGIDRETAVRRLQARLGYMAPDHIVTAEDIHLAVQALTLGDVDYEEVKSFVVNVYDCTTGACQVKSIKRNYTMHSLLTKDSGIAFDTLVDVLIQTPDSLEMDFGEDLAREIKMIRDILLSSDANCVVAELMCLRVDDISTPSEPATFLEIMEPFVGGVIMLNGVLIGVQTDEFFSEKPFMIAVEVAFTFFFLAECLIKVWICGAKKHFLGEDCWWNSFDFVVVLFAIMDTALSLLPLTNSLDTNTLTILRLARLTRLTRLVRIFRLQCLEELTLMVKGLLGGLRTLLWAVLLLFFILYVIGIFLTMMVGHDLNPADTFDHERELYFASLPKSMFTTFRCLLIVDCVSSDGKPLLTQMTRKYGWFVPLCYCLCFVVVSIGLMNLIMAIYIENTLNNAKIVDERNKVARNRESFRVARQLKRLLVIFCSAQQALIKHRHKSGRRVSGSDSQVVTKALDDSEGEPADLSVEITRETFMLCLQDPIVQRLLDDLDVPPERAHLFDILDADCSGQLMPAELVNGLLKVRGETRRGDVVATLLATRCLQSQVRRIETMLQSQISAPQTTPVMSRARTVSNIFKDE